MEVILVLAIGVLIILYFFVKPAMKKETAPPAPVRLPDDLDT
jgi:hypothetical protein